MKRYLNRILSFILVISISITVFLYSSLSAFAFSPEDYIGNTTWDKMSDVEKWNMILMFSFTEGKAMLNGDPQAMLEGQTALNDYINAHSPDDFVNGQNVTIPAELTGMIKQALIQYSEESNGYWLVPTIDIHSIPLEYFPNKNCYDNLHSIIEELEVAGVARNGLYICDVDSYMKDLQLSFVFTGVVSPTNDVPYVPFVSYFYSNKTWLGPYVCGPSSGQSFEDFKYTKYFSNINTEGVSWSDGVTMDKSTLNSSYKNAGPFWFNYNKGKYYTSLDRYNPTSWDSQQARYSIWSVDGRRMKIYKSEKAFLYGIEGERTVYFGSDFYDTTPKEITVTFDEMEDTLNKLGGVLDDLLDKIDKDTDESTIEKLLQQILDEMKNGGGGGDDDNKGNGNNGGSSYDDSGLLSLLSGYFGSVLAYLDGIAEMIAEGFTTLADQLDAVIIELGLIYESIGDMTEDEVSEKTDSMLSSLVSAFSEVGELLKGKFPFSIPWDFYSFLSLLAGNEVAVQSDQGVVMLCAYDGSPGIQTFTDDPEDLEQDGSGAPVFIIPFQISDEIGYPLIIDLEPFDPVSKVARSMLTVLYCVGLMHLTFKVISLGKELSDD